MCEKDEGESWQERGGRGNKRREDLGEVCVFFALARPEGLGLPKMLRRKHKFNTTHLITHEMECL